MWSSLPQVFCYSSKKHMISYTTVLAFYVNKNLFLYDKYMIFGMYSC